MTIFLLTSIVSSNRNKTMVNSMAFKEFDKALSEMDRMIRYDLHNLSDYREDMDIYEQEEFFERFHKGGIEHLNGYDVEFIREKDLKYTRSNSYNSSYLELNLKEIEVQ